MASYNRIILVGNLTRDPELRYLPNNTAVCGFGLAVNHKYRDREGNQKEDVCFIDCSAFGKPGEIINQYVSKGKPLLVEGRLRLETWTAQDGTKRSRHSVFVENFQFLGGRGDEGGQRGGGGGNVSGRSDYEGRSSGPSYDDHGQSEPSHSGPNDEDIPF
ncbi:MAG: single-stranded DNA-binding protein [Phycisphaerae bacterium]